MPGPGRPPKISQEDVLRTALAIANADGLAAVSMRTVAERLDVSTMTLYRHVRDKQDLLDGIVEQVLLEVPLPDPALPWDVRLRALFTAARAKARDYPEMPALLFQRPVVTPGALRFVEAHYAVLADAGVPPAAIPRTEMLVSTYLWGRIASETGGRFTSGTRTPAERRALLDPAVYPRHHTLAPFLEHRDHEDEFAWSLDILTGLVRDLASR